MEPRESRRTRQRRERRRRRLKAALALTVGAATLAGLAASWPANGPHPIPGDTVLQGSGGTGFEPPRDPPLQPQPAAPARPPQFLVVSFDGSGGVKLWPYWRSVARRAGAHFTFFVSGVYLLDEARRDIYHPPLHSAGSSDIGFAQPEDHVPATWLVRGMLQQMALAYGEGDEIGTHYNGHFCAPFKGSVGEWTAADWGRELDEFDDLVFHASANNGLRPAVRLPFGPGEIVGERTPCLQGNLRALFPVLAARGFRYDASKQAVLGTWPYRQQGLWEMPLLEIPFVGHTFRVVSMDYNVFVNQTAAGTPADEIEAQTYDTLWRAFETSYHGNRAPLSFANHFETWNGGAYDRALADVVLRACRLPEVRCVSFSELADWLDLQPAGRLRRYELGRFPVYRG